MNLVTKPLGSSRASYFHKMCLSFQVFISIWGAHGGEELYHWRMLIQDGWLVLMGALSSMVVKPCPACARNGYPKSRMSLATKPLGSLRPSSLCCPCSSSWSLTNLWGTYWGEWLYHWRMLRQNGWPLHIRAWILMVVRPYPTCARNGYPRVGIALSPSLWGAQEQVVFAARA